ncbi:alpha/beta fold hydrolase [Humitalea sp. 24SJ18S-53]|uniref:alpha/beta fold hydrolase n=1 Tax=Humitalea sp. 24SJ18S-53 TaxID=3422307 RepID=UPI003D66E49D
MPPRTGAIRVPFQPAPVTLRWYEWGPADGRPVVCVHGLTRSGRDFDALAQALAADGRRVICPDVPGRGISDWFADGTQYGVPYYVAVLAPMLAALGEYDWVGTSMGGLIAMGVAAMPDNRMRRLVLNDVGPFIPKASLDRIGAYLALDQVFASFAALEAHLRFIHAPFGALSDVEWRHLATTSARVTADGRWRLHYDPAIGDPLRGGVEADMDLWPMWEAVAARPVLLLRGALSDLLLPEVAARMAEAPSVRLETIPGCGHAPALMNAHQTGLIADFLRG